MRFATRFALASASILALSAPAFAQDAAAEEEKDSDIVVTGTLIRGIQATGAQTINIDSKAIVEKGAFSTNEVLALVPQIGNTFNGRIEGDPRGLSQDSIQRPNLRNLPGFNSATGSVTLVQIDGHRITPVGVNEAATDPDIIPAAVLAGVDVLTDGGTSLYGADAVSGVINFRTLKEFNGIKADFNYGFGTTIKSLKQWDAALTVGTKWNSGNAYISGGYSSRDQVLNGDTDWARIGTWSGAGRREAGTECLAPVGTASRYVFLPIFGGIWTNDPRAPGAGTIALGNPCDQFSAQSYVPKQTRYNIFAKVNQELADNIDLSMTAYYTKRVTTLADYPERMTSQAGTPAGPTCTTPGTGGCPTSPFDFPLGIGFSFGANSNYVHRQDQISFATWGITPEVKVGLGSDWQVRTLFHFGQSKNRQRQPGVNTIQAQCYINTTAVASCAGTTPGQLIPTNVGAASAAVIADVLNWEGAQDTNQQMFLARTVADGPIFKLSGGDARLAVGLEYKNTSARLRQTDGKVGTLASLPFPKLSQNVYSAYAEVNLPVHEMVKLSASVRHDRYSDFGNTTNPNVGVEFKPTSWFRLFGQWNKSFNAPTVLDQFGIATAAYIPNGVTNNTCTTNCRPPNDPLGLYNGIGTTILHATGADKSVKPQTAQTWSIGAELKPIDGLRLSAVYYDIKFNNVLGAIDPQPVDAPRNFPSKYIWSPTQAQAEAFLTRLTPANQALLRQQLTPVGASAPNYAQIAYILDRITSNLTSAKLNGIDFAVDYTFPIKYGDMILGMRGNKQIKATRIVAGVESDTIATGASDLALTGNIGWRYEGFSTSFTLNYSNGYYTTDYRGVQLDIRPFAQANLFMGYEFGEKSGALEGTSLRVTIDNVFDRKPQVVEVNSPSLSFARFSFGRVVKLGISKKF